MVELAQILLALILLVTIVWLLRHARQTRRALKERTKRKRGADR
jgi:hypothetical protein